MNIGIFNGQRGLKNASGIDFLSFIEFIGIMKIDKDDLFMAGLIGGLVVCSPFIGAYYGMKWVYNQTPKQKKIKKERKAAERVENEKLDLEIKELEKRLGLTGRFIGTLDYDPYYYKRNSNRKEYLEDLKKKIMENYQSPDIILAIEETKGGITYFIEYSGKCQVLMLANKNIYEIPPHRGTSAFLDSSNAETYFEGFYDFICRSSDLQGRLYTLTECEDMKNYFVVKIPGGFECREVGMENEKIKLFVENFKKNYKKEDANHSLYN